FRGFALYARPRGGGRVRPPAGGGGGGVGEDFRVLMAAQGTAGPMAGAVGVVAIIVAVAGAVDGGRCDARRDREAPSAPPASGPAHSGPPDKAHTGTDGRAADGIAATADPNATEAAGDRGGADPATPQPDTAATLRRCIRRNERGHDQRGSSEQSQPFHGVLLYLHKSPHPRAVRLGLRIA